MRIVRSARRVNGTGATGVRGPRSGFSMPSSVKDEGGLSASGERQSTPVFPVRCSRVELFSSFQDVEKAKFSGVHGETDTGLQSRDYAVSCMHGACAFAEQSCCTIVCRYRSDSFLSRLFIRVFLRWAYM